MFIGGDTKGVNALQDDFGVTMDTLWFAYPGGKLENAVCDQAKNALFFKGMQSYRIISCYYRLRAFYEV